MARKPRIVTAQDDDENAAAPAASPVAVEDSPAVAAVKAQEEAARTERAMQVEGRERQQTIRANVAKAPLSPANAVSGDAVLTVVSPRAFTLQLDNGLKVAFRRGPQECCESLLGHFYVKANKVERYKG